MLEKIDELRSIAQEAALLCGSRYDEPVVNVMWLRHGEIVLTLYAPSLNLNDGKRNHEYMSNSLEGLIVKIDDVITKAKSELYKKIQK